MRSQENTTHQVFLNYRAANCTFSYIGPTTEIQRDVCVGENHRHLIPRLSSRHFTRQLEKAADVSHSHLTGSDEVVLRKTEGKDSGTWQRYIFWPTQLLSRDNKHSSHGRPWEKCLSCGQLSLFFPLRRNLGLELSNDSVCTIGRTTRRRCQTQTWFSRISFHEHKSNRCFHQTRFSTRGHTEAQRHLNVLAGPPTLAIVDKPGSTTDPIKVEATGRRV